MDPGMHRFDKGRHLTKEELLRQLDRLQGPSTPPRVRAFLKDLLDNGTPRSVAVSLIVGLEDRSIGCVKCHTPLGFDEHDEVHFRRDPVTRSFLVLVSCRNCGKLTAAEIQGLAYPGAN